MAVIYQTDHAESGFLLMRNSSIEPDPRFAVAADIPISDHPSVGRQQATLWDGMSGTLIFIVVRHSAWSLDMIAAQRRPL